MAARPLYLPQPRPLTVLFGDIQNQALNQPEAFAGTPGSLLERQNASGFRYYAHQFYDGLGKKREQYVAGPVGDPEAEGKAEALRARIQEARAIVADLRLLGREGYQLVDPRTRATLASLQNHGVFRAGGVLVGSHAFGILLNEVGARAAAYTTQDIDLARGSALAFAEPPDQSLLEMLRSTGIEFVEVPQLDPHQPSTSWKERGRGSFHVDLLVPSADESFPVVPVPELRAHATGLPYLRYLLAEAHVALALNREGCCLVRVPAAERFAVHKLLVSQLRTGREAKSDRDVWQAAVLLAVLGEHHPGAISEALEQLPGSARHRVVRALGLARPLLEEAHPRAWEEAAEADRRLSGLASR